MNLHSLICDDEICAAEALAQVLKKTDTCFNDTVITSTIEDAGAYISAHSSSLQLLFIDIEFNGVKTGISFAKQIHEEYPHILIVFISAHSEYAPEVFDAEPIGFLTKPFNAQHTCETVSRIARALSLKASQTITFPKGRSGVISIRCQEVLYLESCNHCTIVHLADKPPLSVPMKISDIPSVPDYFIRSHKSFLVNPTFVKTVNHDAFILSNGENVPISRSARGNATRKFKDYLGECLR